MANKMLIDASHPEETRVVVVKGNRVEEFDFESEHKKQLKGNIYLAKVIRVEPSLQAAFVEYGGNRHGFLAFSEIHPDYYQIPVADRQALLEDELARAREEEEDDEPKPARSAGRGRGGRRNRGSEAKAATDTPEDDSVSEIVDDADSEDGGAQEIVEDDDVEELGGAGPGDLADDGDDEPAAPTTTTPDATDPAVAGESVAEIVAAAADEEVAADEGEAAVEAVSAEGDETPETEARSTRRSSGRRRRGGRRGETSEAEATSGDDAEQVDEIGSEDAMEEVPTRPSRPPRKQYKIQEVIKRRQILLVQVVKEERGNKGAALTTYLSLAGRYSVLMPNTARGGGISRKITNAADRKRLKDLVRDLEVPRGMGIILRTAGANRTKPEIKRDYEYLMRLWETVRTLTLQSSAPALVYEEGSLIKRSIRDLYNKDIDQVLVAGDGGYREAKDFMRMLMPSQAKVVQPYRELVPIFARSGIEAQLDKMVQPSVTLKSGGYIIINQTEALVAIDVNSGRSTREHSVEDTAYQTNLEAAEEVARQLRLRDLAGLIVIDFIDMEEKRNNRNVEKRLKECLKDDRARIQIGRISHFGLLEMSRQRIRASVLESTMQPCPVCAGNGYIRSESSLALHLLRTLEEHLQKHGTHDVIVKVPTSTALYVLNEKRATIDDLESHHGVRIILQAVEGVGHQHIAIEHGAEAVKRPRPEPVQPITVVADEVEDVEEAGVDEESADEAPEATGTLEANGRDEGNGRRRRRRRRGGRRNGDGDTDTASEGVETEAAAEATDASVEVDGEADEAGGEDAEGRDRKRRRRGRRGGRRSREDGAHDAPVMDIAGGAGADEDLPVVVDDAIAEDDGSEAVAPVEVGDVAERSAEPEMTDAVDAIEGVDLDGARASDLEDASRVVPPDENEVIADTAEAGALVDGNPPLDEVYPDVEDATSVPNEIVESEIEAAYDQADSVTRGPRITSNGEEPEPEADRPKRTGWWAKRSFF
ncbi:Rne/Rng family ribonuclease [Aureimonas jatrophae]|uniref:Ribonuclease E n=1 Tax=Aureimonas jatrophae TaxID=1166073 RepID=A0A1H0MDN5_9HYPH|nr:ribonuclease E/G [Aureimonas jatrophae]MBB3951104.1 ribonuclease E [Aureimonas jatrophae]SDO78467.1 RNAse E [Aureimonas jatrophae]